MVDEIKTKKQKKDYIYAVGRRKESSARVRLYSSLREGQTWGDVAVSKDQILVNGMPIEKYFPGPANKAKYVQPLALTNTLGKYAVTIKVEGGGKAGQLDALVLGLARALALANREKNRSVLKAQKLLKVDARVRERRKVGTGGKARRKKQSPKR